MSNRNRGTAYTSNGMVGIEQRKDNAFSQNLYIFRLSLKHVAEGGTLAEEVISTVRTAQAFGTQKILSALYSSHIGKSRQADMKAAAWHGGGFAIFFFVVYSAYALGKSICCCCCSFKTQMILFFTSF